MSERSSVLDGILIERRQQFLLTWKSNNNANDRNKILAAEAKYLLDGRTALMRWEDKRIKRMHITSCQQSVFLNEFDQKSAHSPAGVWLINEYVKGIASYSCMQNRAAIDDFYLFSLCYYNAFDLFLITNRTNECVIFRTNAFFTFFLDQFNKIWSVKVATRNLSVDLEWKVGSIFSFIPSFQ